MNGAIHPLPNMPSWSGTQLKNRDDFTLTLNNNSVAMMRNCVVGTTVMPLYGGSCNFVTDHRIIGKLFQGIVFL